MNQFIDVAIARRIGRRYKEFHLARGGKMAIFANDYIGIQINQTGFFDRSDLEMVFSFLAPVLHELKVGTALDIGANIGNHAVYFSKYFSSILAFEPHPRTFELLLFNSKTAANVTPYNFGLGYKKETLELKEDWENMGASSVTHDSNSDNRKVEVRIRRLDDIELGADVVSFIKIDVEGFESKVIRGGVETIKKCQPLIILEQLDSQFTGGSTDSIELLKQAGYVFCWHQPWATTRGWLGRRINTLKNIIVGATYDYEFLASEVPPRATYDMLIAVPVRFQAQLLRSPRVRTQ